MKTTYLTSTQKKSLQARQVPTTAILMIGLVIVVPFIFLYPAYNNVLPPETLKQFVMRLFSQDAFLPICSFILGLLCFPTGGSRSSSLRKVLLALLVLLAGIVFWQKGYLLSFLLLGVTLLYLFPKNIRTIFGWAVTLSVSAVFISIAMIAIRNTAPIPQSTDILHIQPVNTWQHGTADTGNLQALGDPEAWATLLLNSLSGFLPSEITLLFGLIAGWLGKKIHFLKYGSR